MLDAPYHGFTDSYTLRERDRRRQVRAGQGSLSLRGTNLLNQKILQHIYGDVMRISLLAELRFFAK